MYYLLYADDCGVPSKVAFDPEEPSLGRIRVDSVTPPHSPASIKRCISRVERNPALAHANLFADISCLAPLKEGHMSILGTDGPGLSPDEPIAIVQTAIVQTAIVQTAIVRVESPSIPDGRYYIKNGAADFFWNCGGDNPITVVYFYSGALRDHVFLPVKSILQLFNCSKDNSLF